MSPERVRAVLFVLMLGTLLWSMRRAAGRLAPKVAIAPLVFLVSRVPVLAAWLAGTIGWLAVLVPPMVAHGKNALGDFLVMGGISAFCGLGFAALLVGPIFMLVRAFATPAVFALEPGEVLLRSVAANHFLGGEARGGKLLVTTRRLAFAPHRFNVQLDPWSARWQDVRGAVAEGLRFLLVDVGAPGRAEWIVTARPRPLAELVRALAAAPESERAAVSEKQESMGVPEPKMDEVRGRF